MHVTNFDDIAPYFPSTGTPDLKFYVCKVFSDDQVKEEILILNDII